MEKEATVNTVFSARRAGRHNSARPCFKASSTRQGPAPSRPFPVRPTFFAGLTVIAPAQPAKDDSE